MDKNKPKKTVVIYEVPYIRDLQAKLLTIIRELRRLGVKVIVTNPQLYIHGGFYKKADAVILYEENVTPNYRRIIVDYNKAGIDLVILEQGISAKDPLQAIPKHLLLSKEQQKKAEENARQFAKDDVDKAKEEQAAKKAEDDAVKKAEADAKEAAKPVKPPAKKTDPETSPE